MKQGNGIFGFGERIGAGLNNVPKTLTNLKSNLMLILGGSLIVLSSCGKDVDETSFKRPELPKGTKSIEIQYRGGAAQVVDYGQFFVTNRQTDDSYSADLAMKINGMAPDGIKYCNSGQTICMSYQENYLPFRKLGALEIGKVYSDTFYYNHFQIHVLDSIQFGIPVGSSLEFALRTWDPNEGEEKITPNPDKIIVK